jgi:hypothetical protein
VATVLAGRHHPHEVMTIVWAVAVGVLHFTTDPPPNSLDTVYPAWLTGAWYLLLGVGGLLGFVGLWLWRRLLISMYLERASMIATAAGAAIYTLAIVYVGGWRAFVAGGLIACWSAACLWRAGQITLDLRRSTRGAV